jgi:N-acetylglucosaminyldiphosphoundecaprenol N-acetyl-beta-D-mannosaminyltransferase
MSVISIFGLNIQNSTITVAAKSLVEYAQYNTRRIVFFVNAHCINIAAKNHDYLTALETADILYADGSGMRIACRAAGIELIDNVNGTDLFPIICQLSASKQIGIALLGAKEGIAKRCAENMRELYPGLIISWTGHGYYDESDENKIIDEINNSGAKIVFVAQGVPKQELWISSNKDKLTAPILIGVGALFDFYSSHISRAPLFIRKIGFEWLYRFLIEPRRLFKRYIIGNPIFLLRTLYLRLRGKKILISSPLIFRK